ncbi:hypothetical protein AB0M43_35680 [Longispora sp. NPDC051575]|uniref:hypothetical protein n=1 Tax=Longispora sp. NPDC051575 TaxID=3154943 RepID=UPI003416F55B
MRTRQPYWQSYWYDLRLRDEGAASFDPLGPGWPQRIPNTWLATRSVHEFATRVLTDAVDELDDLRGELRILVYTEATPGPDTEPVLVRSIELPGRARGRH